MSFAPDQIAALARAERGRTESSKAAARVLHQIDRGKPRTAKQLSAELAYYGVQLSENTVRKLRYVARLLHALDSEKLDPPRLASMHDIELLYRIMRAAEVTHTDPSALLDKLEADNPAFPRDYFGDMIKRKSASASPESKEPWKVPALPRVPASVASDVARAFGVWAKARDLTPALAAQALPVYLRGDSLLAVKMSDWGARLDLPPDEVPATLAALLDNLPAEHWQTLLRVALPPDFQANKLTNKQTI